MDAVTPEDRRYYDEQFRHVVELLEFHEKLDQLRHQTENEARALFATDINRRMHDLNEVRKEVLQDRAEFVPRREHDLLGERIKSLEISRGEAAGKAAAYASIAGLLGVASSILLHFWR